MREVLRGSPSPTANARTEVSQLTTIRARLRLIACAAVAGFVLVSAEGAGAAPLQLTLTAEDLNTLQVFTNTFSDAGNAISVGAGSQGAINFTGEVASATIGPPFNTLITDALSVSNTSTTDTYRLSATLSGQNFAGPDNAVSLTGSGTWSGTPGSTMNLTFFDDPTNRLGASTATDTPGNLVGSFASSAALDPTSSFSFSPGTVMLDVADSGLFSMTEAWTYTLVPGGKLVSRGQTETKSEILPEPASAFLLGAGLTAIGLIRRRTNRG
jgi:hypothetical protein